MVAPPSKRRTKQAEPAPAVAATVAAEASQLVVAAKISKVVVSTSCVNAELQNELAMCDQRIHEHWPNLKDEVPDNRSGVPPFKNEDCKKQLDQGLEYVCTGLSSARHCKCH